ncbi:MAG: cytochrome C nitrite reductase [Pseudomonadota bacterium]
MSRPAHRATGLLAVAALTFAGAALAQRQAPVVRQGGIVLQSATLTLPDDKAAFPEGAAGELVANNCTGCHSAEMILNQPQLGAKWKATVEKMRTAYHAPIAPEDDAAIVAALTAIEAGHRGS